MVAPAFNPSIWRIFVSLRSPLSTEFQDSQCCYTEKPCLNKTKQNKNLNERCTRHMGQLCFNDKPESSVTCYNGHSKSTASPVVQRDSCPPHVDSNTQILLILSCLQENVCPCWPQQGKHAQRTMLSYPSVIP